MSRSPNPLRVLIVVGLTVAASVKFMAWLDLGPPKTPDRPTGTAVVAGTVVDERGQPIADAIVSGRGTEEPPFVSRVVSDADGRFELRDLPAIGLAVHARKDGHAAQAGNDSSLAYLTLVEGQREEDLRLTLPRAGTISGRVMRADGTPAETFVRALRMETHLGFDLLIDSLREPSRLGVTDAEGRYSISGLPPGEYFVEAALDPEETTRVFYPNAHSLNGARPIRMGPSEQRSNVDLHARDIARATVVGRVTDPSGAPQEMSVDISVSGMGGRERRQHQWRTTQTDADGRFRFENVPADRYWLVAHGPATEDVSPAESRWAMSEIVTDGRTPRDEHLVTEASFTITGRVVVDSETVTDPSVAVEGTLSFRLGGMDPRTRAVHLSGGIRYGLAPDGSFVIRNVPAGIYSLLFMPRRGFSVQTLAYDNASTHSLEQPFRVGDDWMDPEIVVTVTDRPNSVRGVVQTDDGAPAPGRLVVVFPQNTSLWQSKLGRIRTDLSDRDGAFRLEGLLPGDYLVATTTGSPGSGYLVDVPLLELLQRRATRVEMRIETHADVGRLTTKGPGF